MTVLAIVKDYEILKEKTKSLCALKTTFTKEVQDAKKKINDVLVSMKEGHMEAWRDIENFLKEHGKLPSDYSNELYALERDKKLGIINLIKKKEENNIVPLVVINDSEVLKGYVASMDRVSEEISENVSTMFIEQKELMDKKKEEFVRRSKEEWAQIEMFLKEKGKLPEDYSQEKYLLEWDSDLDVIKIEEKYDGDAFVEKVLRELKKEHLPIALKYIVERMSHED